MSTVDIVFYINLGLALLSIINAAAIGGMCAKTSYMLQIGLTALFMAGFGLLSFIVQLVLYSIGNGYAVYMVYCTTFLIGCGFVMSAVYCFLLGGRADKSYSTATGVLMFVPPVGTVMIAIMYKRMRADSRAQNLLFNGFAYTLAATGAYTAKYAPEFIDSASEEIYDDMTSREALKHVKQLKKQAKADGGVFKYAEAVAHYFPADTKIAAAALNKAAKLDDPEALFNLGYWHEIGYYYKRDLKKAREYYAKAKEVGDIDSAIRLAIVDIQSGDKSEGAQAFKELADAGNVYALFDYALCLERGDGVDKDEMKAIELYAECAKCGLHEARRRLFWIAVKSVGLVEYDKMFAKITKLVFEGEYSLILEGAIAVKEKRAANAADAFLAAVKYRGKWEGVARMFVGTLYLDCGDTDRDRKNGAAYLKTAIGLTPLAKDIFLTVPVSLRGKYDERKERKLYAAQVKAKAAAEKSDAAGEEKSEREQEI